VDYAVVGMGLNVNLDPGQLPSDLLQAATSLSQQMDRPVPRLPLLWAVLRAIEQRYLDLRAGRSPHDDWAGHLATLGCEVEVILRGGRLDGVAEGVNSDGGLLVRLPDGSLETVLAGDISVRTKAEAKAVASGCKT
jgi:BirA family biotin operon repressor/biotin-[acetyl-CoA-carboxylase] ligase